MANKQYRVSKTMWLREQERYVFEGELIEMDEADPNSDAALFREMGIIVPLSKQEVKDAKNSIDGTGSIH